MKVRVAYWNGFTQIENMKKGILTNPKVSIGESISYHDLDVEEMYNFLIDLRKSGVYLGILQPRLKELLGPLYPKEDCF